MNCGNDDVAGHIVSKLNDHFRQVGLACGNTFVLQELIEVCFLGCHRLDLDDFVDALGLNNVRDDAIRFMLIACPVDNASAGGDIALEFFQKFRESGFDLKLDRFCSVTQIFPVGHFCNALTALSANGAGRVAQIATHLGVCEGFMRGLGEGRTPAKSVFGNLNCRSPSSGVNRSIGVIARGDPGHTDEGFRHFRSPVRFLERRKCCQGKACPWWMQESLRGAWGGFPSSVETGHHRRASSRSNHP